MVALGYSQIPGVYYMDNYAPVVNDVTLRVALTIGVQKKWKRKNLDVETEFLEVELKEKIYMKPPPGFLVILEDMQDAIFKEILGDLADDSAMELARCIYGLVQAGR